MADPTPLTLEAFLELEPWPPEMLARGEPLNWFWRFDLPVAIDDLWPLLTDTSRFNRAIGVAGMRFEERDGVLHGEARNGGFVQRWIEHPWSWIYGRRVVSVREYSQGFAHFVRAVYRLEPLAEDRVRFYAFFGWIPRSRLSRMMLRLGERFIGDGYRRVLGELAAARGAVPKIYRFSAPDLAPEAATRLERLRAQLPDSLDAEAVERLVEHVRRGDEMDVYRIQVRRLAHEWGVDEAALLRAALHATRAGILEMSWDVVCPHCRGVREERRALADVPEASTCEVCRVDFGTDLDNAIEITFHVHGALRSVQKVYYCSAEPSKKAHIVVQERVDPGTSREVAPLLPPGRYRTRLLGEPGEGALDVVDTAEAEPALVWRASGGAPSGRASSPPTLALDNDADRERTFVVERTSWSDEALRPADLLGQAEFRDLFSEQYIGATVQLAVGEQTILFTDVVGSTRFYAERGDPEAFVEVKRHFDAMDEIVRANRGAIVKTIGDAVMAAFRDPVDGLRAAEAMSTRFDGSGGPIRIRVSLHAGPCIAVQLNTSIDFFGNTVNLAAKLQSLAETGQVALSRALYEAPGVAEHLAARGARLSEVAYRSAALDAEVPALRWDVSSSDRP